MNQRPSDKLTIYQSKRKPQTTVQREGKGPQTLENRTNVFFVFFGYEFLNAGLELKKKEKSHQTEKSMYGTSSSNGNASTRRETTRKSQRKTQK